MPRLPHVPALVRSAIARGAQAVALAALAAPTEACTRSKGPVESAAREPADGRPAAVEVRPLPEASPISVATPPSEARIALGDAAPGVALRARGPALIEVSLDGPAHGGWRKIEIERRESATDARQHDTFEPRGAARGVHAAKAGATYAYRARVDGGAWSPEIEVATRASGTPPPPPTSLAARADGAFAADLAWEADDSTTAGFEIEVESKGVFVRAAVVDPTSRAWVHHLRLPGQTYAYRVRAFNARGASAPSAVAKVTTAATAQDAQAPAKRGAPPPCTRLPREPPPDSVMGLPRDVLDGGPGRPLTNDPDPQDAHLRHLYGAYQGCVRELGAFYLQAEIRDVPGFADDGWPLLRAVAGAGQYVGAQIETIRFARGRYGVVDTAMLCGDPWPERDADDPHLGTEGDEKDLARWSPPFADCQRDGAEL